MGSSGPVPAQPIQTPGWSRQPASRAVASPPELRSKRAPPAYFRMRIGNRFETLITRPLISFILGLLMREAIPPKTGAVREVVAARICWWAWKDGTRWFARFRL